MVLAIGPWPAPLICMFDRETVWRAYRIVEKQLAMKTCFGFGGTALPIEPCT